MEIRSGFNPSAIVSGLRSSMPAPVASSGSAASAPASPEQRDRDRVDISAAARALPEDTESRGADRTASARTAASGAAAELKPEELRLLDRLKQRDRTVRMHEQAHVAAGGAHVTQGPSYSYQTGPDGVQYAIGGEVSIDTSAVPGDPEATLAKARTVSRAALAPADPSPQDLRVASQARTMEIAALAELRQAESAPERAGTREPDADAAEASSGAEGARAASAADAGESGRIPGSGGGAVAAAERGPVGWPGADAGGLTLGSDGERRGMRSSDPNGQTAHGGILAQRHLSERIAGFFAAASPGAILDRYA